MNKHKKSGAILAMVSFCILAACNVENTEAECNILPVETILSDSEAPNAQGSNLDSDTETPDPIVGTWCNKRGVFTEIEKWTSLYKTCFSPDGQVVHYGNRNVDRGTWTRTDEDTVTAYFDDCTYTAVGSHEYTLPSYQVIYTYNTEERELTRKTDRVDKLSYYRATWDGNAVLITGTDFDTYEKPLYHDSDECTIYDYYPCYPEETVYCTALEKALLSLADDLQTGKEVILERADLPYELQNVSTYDLTGNGKPEIFAYVEMCHSFDNSGALYILYQKPDGKYTILSKNTNFRGGYTDVLAPDGTELLAISGYRSSSSWKGGIRVHISYRNEQVVVDRDESYSFHWDYPLINYVNDYKNGRYYVYVSRENDTGGAGYGSYIDLEHSLKIDEETFAPVFLPFAEYGISDTDYPAIYHLWSPFDETWWQDGGSYPEDEDQYGKTAYWLPAATDDHPDEMLQDAVEKSDLELERKAYPWTSETKKNVTDLLRCPVADYYYQSDYYAAIYLRGEICFFEKEIAPDGYGEEWVLME